MRFILGLAVVLVLVTGCQPAEDKPATSGDAKDSKAAAAQTPVERGEYLVTVGGCNDCHTPKTFGDKGPEFDLTKKLSGNPAGSKLPPVPAKLFMPPSYGTLASDHLTAWVGPWGVSYAMNLTPDKATGLGSWTEQMFIDAIRTGKHQGVASGRDILPPMPWYWYRHMTDDDLKAVFAYLQSLPPIANAIPDPTPPDKVPR